MSKRDDIEFHATKGWELGIWRGWEEAAGFIMQKAGKAFMAQNRIEADLLQRISCELTAHAKTIRDAYDEKYPKDTP